MNAATRIRASCRGWLAGVVVELAGVVVDEDSWRREDGTMAGMIPIRYVTDRFGFLHDRTSR
jgi:hypothetical protein